jgi:hypothetical protein
MFIVMAGKHYGQERGELDGTLDNVVPESHTEILERAVVVAIVNRKLMGKVPVVFANPIRQAHVDRKPIGNAIVELRDFAEGTNVPKVVTRSVAIIMVLVEQVLIAERHFSLALGRHPRLTKAINMGEQYH